MRRTRPAGTGRRASWDWLSVTAPRTESSASRRAALGAPSTARHSGCSRTAPRQRSVGWDPAGCATCQGSQGSARPGMPQRIQTERPPGSACRAQDACHRRHASSRTQAPCGGRGGLEPHLTGGRHSGWRAQPAAPGSCRRLPGSRARCPATRSPAAAPAAAAAPAWRPPAAGGHAAGLHAAQGSGGSAGCAGRDCAGQSHRGARTHRASACCDMTPLHSACGSRIRAARRGCAGPWLLTGSARCCRHGLPCAAGRSAPAGQAQVLPGAAAPGPRT